MKKSIFFLVFICIGILCFGQNDFQGEATYKTLTKVDIKLDDAKIKSDMQAKIMEQLAKGSQETFMLSFNKEESIYKKEESLAKPQPQTGGFSISFSSSKGDVLYKNTKENRYTTSNESFSKLFLIQDTLATQDWKLENETKNIGKYTCFKATKTYTKKVSKKTSVSFSVNETEDEEEEEEEKEPEMVDKTITVTAWYTPQIPVNSGPDMYYGLPGLILEVNDDITTFLCSKVVLNPDEKSEIKEPQKGKKVNQAEYDAIIKKKSDEMMERFKTRSKRGSGDGVEFIRIGG